MKKCKRCKEEFYPQTSNTLYCWKCVGKKYPLRKRKLDPYLMKLYRQTTKYQRWQNKYEHSTIRKLRSKHNYHRIVNKKFDDCVMCISTD